MPITPGPLLHAPLRMSDLPQNASRLRPLVTTAIEDLVNGLTKASVSGRLGWLEIKRRYRRTIIGPFWSAISLTIFVAALGSIGVGLWNQTAGEYIPFLAAGLIVWVLISSIVTESCTLFVAGQHLYRQMRFDYSVLAYALVWRNFAVFLHNLIVYFVCVLFFAPHFVRPVTLLAIPGMAILLVNGAWIALFLGIICLRFRDLQQFVTTMIQIIIFITPIFWPPELLKGMHRIVFVSFNPIFHLIEIVRAPLIGKAPTPETWLAVLIITVGGWTMTYFFFDKFRKRIAYWA